MEWVTPHIQGLMLGFVIADVIILIALVGFAYLSSHMKKEKLLHLYRDKLRAHPVDAFNKENMDFEGRKRTFVAHPDFHLAPQHLKRVGTSKALRAFTLYGKPSNDGRSGDVSRVSGPDDLDRTPPFVG